MIDSFPWIDEIKTTLPSLAAAKEIADVLVDRRLAACVQITGPILSVYRWQGAVNKDEEFSLVCKTISSRRESLIECLLAHHPYRLAEVLCSQSQATPEYAKWVIEQVG